MIQKRYTSLQKTLAVIFASGLFLAGCSSSSNDDSTTDGSTPDDTVMPNPDVMEVSITLDSTSTVPPANVDGAGGEGSFTVDTSTGAISGSVTVFGLTGPATDAHIHAGAAGEAGGVVVGLEPNADNTTWSTPEGTTLDAASIALFNEGRLYVNVHTEANAPGEVRAQLIDNTTAAPGTVTISFRNTSTSQPITPPVVALHNAPGTDNGIRLFEVGQPAIGEVIEIAENGNNTPLADVVTGQIANGTVTAGGVAVPDPAGPLLPGGTSSITLDLASADQVLSIVAMVVCTNDGFTGVDSRALSTDSTETFTTPIYDAGSETNVLTLDYWVPPCSDGAGSPNLGDVEGGAIMAHPGQSGSENPSFDFEAGSEFLEVTVTRN